MTTKMQFTAVVDDTLSFGRYPYPAEHCIEELESKGYTIFIDLTTEYEVKEKQLIEYKQFLSPSSRYCSFPINDRCVPNDSPLFCNFMKNVINDMLQNDKVYIHCRGGHGRAGLAAATFLILKSKHEISPQCALDAVFSAHQKRPEMRSKWRKMGSPQGNKQKNFVRNMPKQSGADVIEPKPEGYNDFLSLYPTIISKSFVD
uniref:Dual specificity phosphatase n=1 Tax=Pithovirus LCPAC404 TaxID=2506597 RepID=A0A481ZEU5_9VIRU|nr:MAG: dual specificity phosphatase [Pithovirus LCPAC404]